MTPEVLDCGPVGLRVAYVLENVADLDALKFPKRPAKVKRPRRLCECGIVLEKYRRLCNACRRQHHKAAVRAVKRRDRQAR